MPDSCEQYQARWRAPFGATVQGVNGGIPVGLLTQRRWLDRTASREDLLAYIEGLQAKAPSTLTTQDRITLEGVPDLIRQYGMMLLP